MGFALPKDDLPAAASPSQVSPLVEMSEADISEFEIRIDLQYQGLIARQELEAVFGEGLFGR